MSSGFEMKILICGDCGEEFVFTIAAQEYFAEKGYTEDPKLCKTCYMQLKREKKSQGRNIEADFDYSTVKDE
ncbi:MAG: zinc-ribbon domain containing protein [candidate division Zixibacteria bacterium]